MLGERWKALSEKQRQPYEAKAAADKKRYEQDKAAYAVSFSSYPLTMPLANKLQEAAEAEEEEEEESE